MLKSLESKNELLAESDMFSKKKLGTQKKLNAFVCYPFCFV